MTLYSNIVYNGDKAYKILDIVSIHNFTNKDGNVNKQVLGMYVSEKKVIMYYNVKTNF